MRPTDPSAPLDPKRRDGLATAAKAAREKDPEVYERVKEFGAVRAKQGRPLLNHEAMDLAWLLWAFAADADDKTKGPVAHYRVLDWIAKASRAPDPETTEGQ